MIKLSLQYYPDDLQSPDNRDFKLMRLWEVSSAVRTLRRQAEAIEEKISFHSQIPPGELADTK